MVDVKRVNHYKIEDAIMRFWNVKDHIKLLTEKYIDHPTPMTEDEMWNQLSALEAMVELYIDAGMDTYCKVFELNEYASDEAKANRAEWVKNITKNQDSWEKLFMSTTRVVKKKGKKK
jgi:hypothetical protein